MHIDFYETASYHVTQSWIKWEEKRYLSSFASTIPARLCYLCEAIINLVKLPFAILAVIIGSLYALACWDRKTPLFQMTYSFIARTSNRLFLSAFGSMVSPSITHKYRDANITPFIIAARIMVITGGLLYALLKK